MPVIAVDGPAASGKGTLAKRLAKHYGFHHLDTGLLYRAVGLRAPDGDRDQAIAAATSFDVAWLDNPVLRGETVGAAASRVSAIPEVRSALFDYQVNFARQAPGAVLDGRDIGTVICPDAEAKFFVTATVEVRAGRRLKELRERGSASIYAAVLQDLIDRDARDASRATAPMAAAPDAFVLDTSGMDADQVFQAALGLIGSRIT